MKNKYQNEKQKVFNPNFNDNHPEKKSDEIFLINLKEGKENNFNNIDFITDIRAGNTAYTNTGDIVEGFKPLFGKLICRWTQ